MIDVITTRLASRMNGEDYNETVLAELAQTVTDRLCLRIGIQHEEEFPAILYSVIVDATVKAYRRRFYEGIKSENVASLSTSFVDDILDEYAEEIRGWLETDDAAEQSTAAKIVRFI